MIVITILALALGMQSSALPAQSVPADPLPAASLEKLKTITLGSSNKTSTLDDRVVTMLGMTTGGEAVTVKQFKAESTVGLYVLTIPVKPASDAVVFSFRDPSGVTYNYLSDGTRTLRSAMASDAEGNRALTTEQAQEGFRNALKAWALIASKVKAP